ncbi:MAG: hypothetical protein HOV81_14440 [Kofleriaceae bacterium]|nr:hypothetical protein [Kofleriaceae bacterium]
MSAWSTSVSRAVLGKLLAAPKRTVALDGASHMPTEHPGVEQLEAAVVELVNALAQA